MLHLITIERHQTTNFVFESETDAWESVAQEFADAIDSGAITIDWDTCEKPVDVMNVYDRLDPTIGIQTTNAGTGENIVSTKDLPVVTYDELTPKSDFGGDDGPEFEEGGELVP